MSHCLYSYRLPIPWLFTQPSFCISQIQISENLINAARLFHVFKKKIKLNRCQEERNFSLVLGKLHKGKIFIAVKIIRSQIEFSFLSYFENLILYHTQSNNFTLPTIYLDLCDSISNYTKLFKQKI